MAEGLLQPPTVSKRGAAMCGAPKGSISAARRVNRSYQIGRGLGIGIVITLATALLSHLIGTGGGPQALIDRFRLGPRGQLVAELGYYVAPGPVAAAIVVIFALLPTPARKRRRARRRAQVAVTVAAVLACFVVPDFAAGASPLGAYTTRGAYTFVSAPGLHPPIVRADVTEPGRFAKGYILLADLYDPSDRRTMVGQSGPLILDQRLSPVWFRPVPENELAVNLSLQIYEGRPVLAWWQGQITPVGTERDGEYVVVDDHYRPVATLRGIDRWVLTLHDIVISGDDAWVTATKNVPMNLSHYGGARNGAVADSAIQEYNLKTGKLIRSWDALAHIPLSDSRVTPPATSSP